MEITKMLKPPVLTEKKVVVLGLDNSGKTSLTSFLQTGTYIEHTPTIGRTQFHIDIQGLRMNIVDIGGHSDLRPMWLGELVEAECVIYMVDANDTDRFTEAREELWNLSEVIGDKPLIVLASKYDLKPVASVPDIIQIFGLMSFPNFEILPVSSKKRDGILNAVSKVYYKLIGRQLTTRIAPKALTVFDKGGVPLTTHEGEYGKAEILRGGLFAAITSFAQVSFQSELNQIRLGDNIIIFKKSTHFMCSLIIDERSSLELSEAALCLKELLDHLENMCPEVEQSGIVPAKVDYLVKEYAPNIFC